MTIQYRVIRLSEIEGEAVIRQRLWGLLPFATLMKPPQGISPTNWLRQCIQSVDEIGLDRSTKANFLTEIAILSGLAHTYQTITQIISEEIRIGNPNLDSLHV